MQTSIRKLVTIIMEARVETLITRDLTRLGAHGYTVTEARGMGARGVRAANWEADRNIRIEVLCKEEIGRAVLDHLYAEYFENYAMVAFLQDVEVLRPEKF
jgi:nitrogen regulatory protein PII